MDVKIIPAEITVSVSHYSMAGDGFSMINFLILSDLSLKQSSLGANDLIFAIIDTSSCLNNASS